MCGGVSLVESFGDDDLGKAGPDGGDGRADTRVVECGAAPAHDLTERHVVRDVHTIEIRHGVGPWPPPTGATFS